MDDLDEVLVEMLSKSYSQIILNEERILKKLSDITLKELRTLELIAKVEKNGNNTSTYIANILGISLGTLTANIDRLIKKGLVNKEKSQLDKRTTIIILSSSGKKILKDYKNEHLNIIKKAMVNLSQKEKAIIVSLVTKFDI